MENKAINRWGSFWDRAEPSVLLGLLASLVDGRLVGVANALHYAGVPQESLEGLWGGNSADIPALLSAQAERLNNTMRKLHSRNSSAIPMNIRLHKTATTNPVRRACLQSSPLSVLMLAVEQGCLKTRSDAQRGTTRRKIDTAHRL